MANIPSLGLSGSNLSMIQETIPLPKSRKEIASMVETVLEKGGVQKIVVEVGKPVTISRLVKSDEVPIPKEIIIDDLASAVRNAEIVELLADYYIDIPFRYLFNAFRLIANKGLSPKAMIVKSIEDSKKWFGLRQLDTMTDVFGVELVEHKDTPEDVLIFVATKDGDDVQLSVKLLMVGES